MGDIFGREGSGIWLEVLELMNHESYSFGELSQNQKFPLNVDTRLRRQA
jgi:hypothetical protein